MTREPGKRARLSVVEMTIYEHIEQMKPFIKRTDWAGLEEEFCALAENLGGTGTARPIKSLDFDRYQQALSSGLDQAKRMASRLEARAIYLEYDLDNDWESTFFLCKEYRSEAADDDDWACDYVQTIPGPAFPEASAIYDENGFDRTPLATGSTLYLIARTVASFGRVACLAPSGSLPICIAYHDQDPIFRISD